MAITELRECSDRNGASRFRHGHERARVAECLREPGVITKQTRKRGE
jgi:hypothetical protein